MMMMMVRRRVRKRCMRARSEAMPEDAFRSEALTCPRGSPGGTQRLNAKVACQEDHQGVVQGQCHRSQRQASPPGYTQ